MLAKDLRALASPLHVVEVCTVGTEPFTWMELGDCIAGPCSYCLAIAKWQHVLG
jgi:hypothetical protein